MITAYGLSIFIFILTFRDILSNSKIRKNKSSRFRRIFIIITIFFGWIIFVPSVIFPIILPVFQLPIPTGSYKVGCTNLYFIDKYRSESFTSDDSDFRQIWSRIWYPANLPVGEKKMNYMDETAARAVANWWNLPSFIFKDFALVKTHAYANVPIQVNSNPYPIIFFNHGYQLVPHMYTVLMEELASHGYVVFSVGHAYETPFFEKPDGSYIVFEPQNEFRQLRLIEGSDTVREKVIFEFPKTNTWHERDSLYKELFKISSNYNESIRIWAADVSSIINLIDSINNTVFFGGMLDPNHIGVIGHSFGGASAGQATLIDTRIKAGINIDGLQNGDMAIKDLQRPYMFVASHTLPFSDENGVLFADPFFERSNSISYIILIKNSKHENFSDLPLMGPLMKKMTSGEIDPYRCTKIVNTFILEFIGKYLKEEESKLLDGNSRDYPEVVLWTKNPL
jgi:hypothetical protein